MSNSVQLHRRQPTRLPCPWDSPGKNTGAGCHFLLPCMKVKSESEVPQSCPTLSDPMNCSLPGSSIHGIFQARVLEWVPLPSPKLMVQLLLIFDLIPVQITFPSNSIIYCPLNHLPEKATAPHSSTLAWKIPWMEEPGRLQFMGSLRVGHD